MASGTVCDSDRRYPGGWRTLSYFRERSRDRFVFFLLDLGEGEMEARD